MQLPAISRKITRLSRIYKVLLLIIIGFILVLIAEGSYYLWVTRKVTEESRLIDTGTTYQEGVYLRDRQTKEVVALRGKVVEIDGWFLTIENQGKQISLEIDRGFTFAEINQPSAANWADQKLDLKKGEYQFGEELIKKGVVIRPDCPVIDNLNEIVNIGDFIVVDDFVVISDLNQGDGSEIFKGNDLSVLEFLK